MFDLPTVSKDNSSRNTNIYETYILLDTFFLVSFFRGVYLPKTS